MICLLRILCSYVRGCLPPVSTARVRVYGWRETTRQDSGEHVFLRSRSWLTALMASHTRPEAVCQRRSHGLLPEIRAASRCLRANSRTGVQRRDIRLPRRSRKPNAVCLGQGESLRSHAPQVRIPCGGRQLQQLVRRRPVELHLTGAVVGALLPMQPCS